MLPELLAAGDTDSPAIAGESGTCTYGDLDAAVARLARAFEARGTRPGTRVGVWLPNGEQFVVTVFAIAAAGGCAVLLDARMRPRELEIAIRRADVRLVVTTPALWATLDGAEPGCSHAAWRADSATLDLSHLDAGSLAPTDEDTSAEDATMLLTSGTTSAPKAVVLTHHGLVQNARATAAALGLEPTDRGVVVLSLSHAYALNRQLLSHMSVGACLRLLRPSALADQVIDSIARERATTFAGTPTIFEMLLMRSPRPCRPDPLASLRVVTTGAFAMSPELRKRLADRLPAAAIYSTYGLSEAGSLVSVLVPDRFLSKPRSVGSPVRGVSIAVESADRTGVGEVVVRTPAAMRAYFRDGAATKRSKREDGWLRTGDLGVIDRDGDLALVARKGELINRGGEDVAPAEIEEVLRRHPRVLDAATIGVPHPLLGEEPVAAVVVSDPAVDAPDIGSWCRERLAPYKVPARIVPVDTICRTLTGKVDSAALRRRLGHRA